MNTNSGSRFGYFTLFGFTQNPQFLAHHVSERLGIVPRTLDFGSAGVFFFYSSYSDIGESEEIIALKLGFIRSPTLTPLSAQQLLAQKIVTEKTIDPSLFRGNGLVASFNKREPGFLVFKTLLSAPQLYYSTLADGILCATGLRFLTSLLDRVEQNEAAIVPQFLFGTVHGSATHFRNVYRLLPGELLQWQAGKLAVNLVQDLRFENDRPLFKRADAHALNYLWERFSSIVGTYLTDMETSGGSFANLLSGGVDSSLVQLTINEQRPGSPRRSFSYNTLVPSFKREIEYAQQAAAVFKTSHTFIDIPEAEFPNLLIKATGILAQPALTSAEICKVALAEAIPKLAGAPQFLFLGQGADALFGLGISQKIKILESLRKIPASGLGLTLAGVLLKPFARQGQTMLNLADILEHWHDPDHFAAPINAEATIANIELARRCFGYEAIRQALAARRELEAVYLGSQDYLERIHVMDLLTDCYAVEAQASQLFLAYNLEQLYPFLDEDTIRLSFNFRPQARYFGEGRSKYLLKKILEQRVASPITRQPKGGSMFHADLHRSMQSGSLQEMVRDISPLGSMRRADLEALIKAPNLSLWHLLAFDVFQKQTFKVRVETQ
jgi:asparagine synthetase B (glutamine-hydrolysing)